MKIKKATVNIFFIVIFFSVIPFPLTHAEERYPLVTPTPIAYDLPYPGILPGETLYPFKEAKESLLRFFISDPQDKALFSLEQAEKYIQASYLLFFTEKNKQEYVFISLAKAADYSENTFSFAQEATKQGKDGHLVITKLAFLLEKQKELLATMLAVADDNQKALVQTYEQKLFALQKKVYSYQESK